MNRSGLLFTCLFILIAWLLDVLSSIVGVSLGLTESSQLFVMFPFMWLIVFVGLSTLIYYFHWAPVTVRKILLTGIVFGSFVPSIWNTYLIFLVIL